MVRCCEVTCARCVPVSWPAPDAFFQGIWRGVHARSRWPDPPRWPRRVGPSPSRWPRRSGGRGLHERHWRWARIRTDARLGELYALDASDGQQMRTQRRRSLRQPGHAQSHVSGRMGHGNSSRLVPGFSAAVAGTDANPKPKESDRQGSSRPSLAGSDGRSRDAHTTGLRVA